MRWDELVNVIVLALLVGERHVFLPSGRFPQDYGRSRGDIRVFGDHGK